MIPIPNLTTLATLILGIATFILIAFLPALLELKRPRDAGPRTIAGEFPPHVIKPQLVLARMEEEFEISQALIGKIAGIIAVLPSLEG